jgi:glycosidase
MIILPLRKGVRLEREFHVARAARERYQVASSLVDLRGRVMVVDPAAAERLAARMNEARDARRFPEAAVSGAEIVAAGLLDEAVHLMLDAYRRERDAAWSARLDAHLTRLLGPERATAARTSFVTAFPPKPVMDGTVAPDAWLSGTVDELPAHEVALEERIAVRLANENPALERFRELVDDSRLGSDDAALAAAMERRLEELPGLPGTAEDEDLWSLLRAPMRASPTSLEGQLDYVRRHWGARLGPRFETLLTRLLRSLDMLAELRAGGPPGPPGPAPVLDRAALTRGRDEPEAYSPDADWMPSVVLVAKNAYVWLDQLSRWSGREVRRLDEVPDEALAELSGHGFTGLWLIGLWERSQASARIKRLRGQEDAVASAYALWDYRIANDLGGEEAWRTLRDRAWRHGIRLAADMVPNHVGIDGRWVVEHPERFLSLPHPPYPGYAFTGPDLSGDDRIEVRIEDGYWESRDAAVVFERIDRASGERRYVYHGNDGTSMPWNDTAQIDYLDPGAREAVIGVILDVARKFPIIRFDAAMTLAKQHVQRLWYPPPGEGGAIPSRSAFGSLDHDEFERRMPVEFWREVVDRVAAEAPDTLLLAEAFWMMEGYFVRSLGMHRVYNSAFMNMLAREANEDYQRLMRNVLAFDPQMLARFVNFMNNPDEETAIAQFGDGDKAYGVTTLMATLPGLPMFGHGQVEGLREKYGMEYRRARLDERPDHGMVARHRREIEPLLRRRREFAGTDRFRLLEVEGEQGPLHDVFAYCNGLPGGGANLVLYHNRYAEASGVVRRTAPFADPPGGATRSESLAEALGLRGGADRFVRYRDLTSGLEHLVPSDAWRTGGLPVRLGAYQRRVLADLTELRDVDGRWSRLERELAGRGVPDLEDALRELDLAPVHEALTTLVRPAAPPRPVEAPARVESGGATAEADTSPDPAALDAFLAAVSRIEPRLRLDAAALRARWSRIPSDPAGAPGVAWRRAWAVASSFERPAEAARTLRLDVAVGRRLVAAEEDPFGVGAEAWAALWRALLPARRSDEPPAPGGAPPSAAPGEPIGAEPPRGRAAEATIGEAAGAEATGDAEATGEAEATRASDETEAAEALAELDVEGPVRRVLGVHEHEGVRWFRREGFEAWRAAWAAVQRMEGTPLATVERRASALGRAAARSGYRFDALIAPSAGSEAATSGDDAPHGADRSDRGGPKR